MKEGEGGVHRNYVHTAESPRIDKNELPRGIIENGFPIFRRATSLPDWACLVRFGSSRINDGQVQVSPSPSSALRAAYSIGVV
ncbi:uncharacterized protein FOMMEDRAFT_154828 [Fomitiporia mediterranea MF3/22]|uniref:uncharacterized protein n=1 Tax=Fomitiporia mediterranea (strain MF3/22) TaxID=694068 RepID=UPI0004408396|nr:uncharacterized protein FOMMEDRAFT_154828 [Fomitiporia mediterranea MF3/22]EJD03725.1 hypothetical protein FOMMEDRAFT_154828 [Fomitiporia mediterranea MF3/22]